MDMYGCYKTFRLGTDGGPRSLSAWTFWESVTTKRKVPSLSTPRIDGPSVWVSAKNHGKSPSGRPRWSNFQGRPLLPKAQLLTLDRVLLRTLRCFPQAHCLPGHNPCNRLYQILRRLERLWCICLHLCQSFVRSSQSFQPQNAQTFAQGQWVSLEMSKIPLAKDELLPRYVGHLHPLIHPDLQALHPNGPNVQWLHHLMFSSLEVKPHQWLCQSCLASFGDRNQWLWFGPGHPPSE